jgi:hypothetical protein
MQEIYEGHTIQFVFENGLNFSMVQHRFSYSTDKNVEIAVIDNEGNFITKDFIDDLNDDVKGWVDADEAISIMEKVRLAN